VVRESHQKRLGPWVSRLAVLGLAAIPLACLIVLVIRYAVDVPYRDEWALLGLLQKARQGGLSLHDLWLQHNEHRMLLPRIILLALAGLTRWNISYELAVNILLAVGILAAIVYQAGRTQSSLGAGGANLLIPALSLLVFSLKQAENWLMGFQLSFFLSVLAAVAGIVALAMPVFRWWRFLAALGLGLAASYSTANGLLYWLVALPVLFALPLDNRRAKRTCIAIWLLVALATIGSYLHDYHRPPHGQPITFFLKHPLDYIVYVLCYLGNPLGPNHILATALAGVLGVVILVVAGFLLARSRYLTIQALAPYYSLALYSVASALLTGLGRAGLGPLQAKVSRYVTMENPFWIAVFVLLYLLFRVSVLDSRKPAARRQPARAQAGVALAIFLVVVFAAGRSSVKSIPLFRDWHATLAPARAELLAGRNPTMLMGPNADAQWLRNATLFLREQQLSVFRKR